MKKALLLILVFVGCHQSSDLRIQRFNDFLGSERVAVINQATFLLDSALMEKYNSQDINEAYYRFINDVEEERIDWKELIESEKIQKLHELSKSTGLWKELYMELRGSIVEKGEILTTYSYSSSDNLDDTLLIENSYNLPSNSTATLVDSMVKLQSQILEFNIKGKYFMALKEVENGDSLIMKYLEQKEISGRLTPIQLASAFKYSNIDFNDYFVRRIFAVELMF